jgi:hypothetical protein
LITAKKGRPKAMTAMKFWNRARSNKFYGDLNYFEQIKWAIGMDSIKAIYGLSPHCGDKEHLCIFINGTRLDEILSKIEADFFGLVPSLLDWYDEGFPPSAKEKQYVWSQAKLEGGTRILPILLCPDDFDFSCTTIVVEVIDSGETVLWNRFGVDVTEFSSDEAELPKYIGKKVNWFPDVKPFVFSKSEYLKCIGSFERNLT